MSYDLARLELLVSGLDHPEGVAYAPNGYLYASGESGQVYEIDLSTKTFREIGRTGGFGLGIAVDAASNLYISKSLPPDRAASTLQERLMSL
jgi:sugar lactone lactonase YvrE